MTSTHKRVGRWSAAILVVVAMTLAAAALPTSFAQGTDATGFRLLNGKGGKLSPRLQALTEPATQALSSAQLAERLSLPEDGPGSLMRDGKGRVLVYVRVADTSDATVQAIRATGATVVHVAADYLTVTARAAVSELTGLASLANVVYIREEYQPLRGSDNRAQTAVFAKAFQGPRIQAACPSGDFVSEGDTQLNAKQARTTFSVNGAGVKVGILSDSYNVASGVDTDAAADIAAGDLPGAANPCGYTTPVQVLKEYGDTDGIDEGRAMLHIIHDLAPGSPLAFATAFDGLFDFADQIRALRNAGSKVIVDDISYFVEPVYQEGPVGIAASEVVSTGSIYFSSAGNANEIVGGKNVASYEAPALRLTACPAISSIAAYTCHDFNTGAAVDNGSGLTLVSGGSARIMLQWAEPWFGIKTDMAIFAVDTTNNTIVAGSDADSLGAQVPYESITVTNSSGSTKTYNIVVARFNPAGGATPRFRYQYIRLSGAVAVEYDTSTGGDVVGPTIFGHNGGADVISTAAVPYSTSNTPEDFTSQGPVKFLFGPARGVPPAFGTPTTVPAATAYSAPLVLDKPDIAATDGNRNSFFGSFVGGVYRFFGTSSAAPHAGAVAALMVQRAAAQGRPTGQTPVLLAMKATARDIANNGTPEVVGAGLVDAVGAINKQAQLKRIFLAKINR